MANELLIKRYQWKILIILIQFGMMFECHVAFSQNKSEGLRILQLNKADATALINQGFSSGLKIGQIVCANVKNRNLPVCMPLISLEEDTGVVQIPAPYLNYVDENNGLYVDESWLNHKLDPVLKSQQAKVPTGKYRESHKTSNKTPDNSNVQTKEKISKEDSIVGSNTINSEKVESKNESLDKKNKKVKKKVSDKNISKIDEKKTALEKEAKDKEMQNDLNSNQHLEKNFPETIEQKESDTIEKKKQPAENSKSITKRKKQKYTVKKENFFEIGLSTNLSIQSKLNYNYLSFNRKLNNLDTSNWLLKGKNSKFTESYALFIEFPAFWMFQLNVGLARELYQSRKFVSDYELEQPNLYTVTETKAEGYGLWGDLLWSYGLFSWYEIGVGTGLELSSYDLVFSSLRLDEESKEIGLLADARAKLNFISLRLPLHNKFTFANINFYFSFIYSIPVFNIKNELISEIGLGTEDDDRLVFEDELRDGLAYAPAKSSSQLVLALSYKLETTKKAIKKSKKRKKTNTQ